MKLDSQSPGIRWFYRIDPGGSMTVFGHAGEAVRIVPGPETPSGVPNLPHCTKTLLRGLHPQRPLR